MHKETFIEQLKNELHSQGLTLGTRRATQWLVDKIGLTKSLNRSGLMSDEERMRNKWFIGGMFFFWYDPKTKETLPWYDKFPLTIPIDVYPDGFLGLNLHYLGPRPRIALLEKLMQYTNNTQYDERTKFMLTYKTLAGASRIQAFRPCLHRYLSGYIRSNFLSIPADEWYIAAVLPVQSFSKASASAVWAESLRIVRRMQ